MQTLSLIDVVAAGIWLVGVGLLMAVGPSKCLRLFTSMSAKLEASDWRIHLLEQSLRMAVGAALIIRSPASNMPLLLWVFGWMLVFSSAMILALPVRWHGAFGRWWSDRLTSRTIRLLSPVSVLMGCGLIYVAV